MDIFKPPPRSAGQEVVMSRVSLTQLCVCRQLLQMLSLTLWSLWLCRSAGVASVGPRKPRQQQKRRESRQRRQWQPGEQHGGLQQGKRRAPPHTQIGWFIDQLLLPAASGR